MIVKRKSKKWRSVSAAGMVAETSRASNSNSCQLPSSAQPLNSRVPRDPDQQWYTLAPLPARFNLVQRGDGVGGPSQSRRQACS
jgi:hypothetical protein